jgi:glycosyltransferase involved in cell wall biosynthesis
MLNEHYDVAISAFYGLQGAPITWRDMVVLPGLGNDFGGEYLADHAKAFFKGGPRDGLVMTLLDVWTMGPDVGAEMNVLAWTPVDHEPAPGQVLGFFATGAMPLAMSRFGQQQLREGLGFADDVLYCPHGIDTEVLRPMPRDEARKKIGLSEDAFLVGMVAANKGRPSRKGFLQAFQAFRRFQERHSDAHLLMHTMADPALGDGENVVAIMRALGIPPETRAFTDQYRNSFAPYKPDEMALLYSAMDVLLNPAMGEGFGIPVLEAQACGVPVIVTDFSAMPEVAGAGWHVEYQKAWTGMNSWQARAEPDDIVEALNHCYSLGEKGRRLLGEKARAHALGYDCRVVFRDFMLPAVREAEARFAERERPVELAAA